MFQDDMDKDGKAENVGFETSAIVLSKGLFDASFVNDITLRYSPDFTTDTRTITIPAKDLYQAIQEKGGNLADYDQLDYLTTLDTYNARIADEAGDESNPLLQVPSLWTPLVEGQDVEAAKAKLLARGYNVKVTYQGTVDETAVAAIKADYEAGNLDVAAVVDAIEALGLQAKLLYSPEEDKDEWYDPNNTSFDAIPVLGSIIGWNTLKADTTAGAPLYAGDVVEITVYGDPDDDRYYAPAQEAKTALAVGTVVAQTPAQANTLRTGHRNSYGEGGWRR